MAMTADAPGMHAGPRAVRPHLEILHGPEALDRVLEGATHRPTPFQSDIWLRTWYRHFCAEPAQSPCLVVARDPRITGPRGHVAAWPLVRRRRHGLPGVEFADRGVTDVNASLPGPAFDPHLNADALLVRLTGALRPFARLLLARMEPRDMLARAATPEVTARHVLPLGEGLDAHLGPKKRKDLRRRMRNLEALGHPPVLRLASTQGERDAVLDLVHASQVRRHAGPDFLLDDLPYRAFYADLAGPGATSLVRMAGLWLGEAPIAGAMLLTDRDACIVIRLGMCDAPEITHVGPGKLMIRALADWAAREGYRALDLSIGANDLKTWFRCRSDPLLGLTRLANGWWDGLPFRPRS